MHGHGNGAGTGAGRGRPRRRDSRRSAVASLARLAGNWLKCHPGGVLTGLVFLGAAGAISVNALTLQGAPHPARSSPAAMRSALTPRMASNPPRRHDVPARGAISGSRNSMRTNRGRNPDKTLLRQRAPARNRSASFSMRRCLRRAPRRLTVAIRSQPFLRDNDGPSVTGSTDPRQTPSAEPRVRQAQQALNAIGYGDLTEDGLMGPMTRDAIMRFERDQGLAQSGRLEGRTADALSRASGIALD